MADSEAIDRFGSATVDVLLPPPGSEALPEYDDGWLTDDARRDPFLGYVESAPAVNWSVELERLHEEASRTHFLDRWTRAAIIARLGRLSSQATIVDVGCSTGYLLEDLAQGYPTATLFGLDLVESGLVKAHRAVPSARLVRADACELPFADQSVEAIVSANLLEHVPDDEQALREMARILRPGARALIVVPAGPGTYDYYDRFLGHQRRYARGELAVKCRRAGLEVLEDLCIASLLYPAFWLVKRRNRLLHDGLRGSALARRVASDIAKTNDSRVGELLWQLEDRLVERGIRLPFGVRSLVALHKRRESA